LYNLASGTPCSSAPCVNKQYFVAPLLDTVLESVNLVIDLRFFILGCMIVCKGIGAGGLCSIQRSCGSQDLDRLERKYCNVACEDYILKI